MGLRWRGSGQEERQGDGLRGLGRGGPQPHVITVTGSAFCAQWAEGRNGATFKPTAPEAAELRPPGPRARTLGGWEVEEGGRKGPQFPHSQSLGVRWSREEGEGRGHGVRGQAGGLRGGVQPEPLIRSQAMQSE